MDVPTAVNNGTNTGPRACPRWGYTLAFDAQTLATLYRNHGRYISRVDEVTERNLADRYILGPDAERTIDEAAHSTVGKRGPR